MIPPNTGKKTPPGEKLLFEKLRTDPETEHWVVLHSFGIANHTKNIEGEVDFVVLIPDEGILFLEVKSGIVKRENGLWKYGREPFTFTSVTGPFRQASEGMHSIRKYVAQKDRSLSNLLFFSGVFFTMINFEEQSAEWHSWQFADHSMIMREPVSTLCVRILRKAREHLRAASSARWFNDRLSRPDTMQINNLLRLLRANFEYYVSPRAELEAAEKNVLRYTEEQFSALDVIEENRRVVFKGPAGTGKTILALETARRQSGKERSVIFICYNRFLGKWLDDETTEIRSNTSGYFRVGTFHKILLELSGTDLEKHVDDDFFWTKTLPEIVIERILDGIIKSPLFDFIIIDEAQDLLTEEYLDVLDLLLKGGLAGGQWVAFGDFERQAIYSPEKTERHGQILKALLRRSPQTFIFPLRTNCRNTQSIAAGIEMTCNLDPGYSKILNDTGTDDIDFHFYKDSDNQTKLLKSALRQLNERFRPSEIVVLSPKRNTIACAQILCCSDTNCQLEKLRRNKFIDHKYVPYSTIHSFKGLESPAVILTDIEKIKGESAVSLLYVGMSRARHHLVMLIHQKCREDFFQAVQHGLLRKKKAK